MKRWTWNRFHANDADPRPVQFPPPGPYWITGYGEDHATVVAYLPEGVLVTDYWPEATHIQTEKADGIVFSERFAKPDWWMGEEQSS